MGRLRRGCLLAVPGLIVWTCGLFYVGIIVGIPYQDPPPALEAEYERRTELGGTVENAGLGLALLGMIAGLAWRR